MKFGFHTRLKQRITKQLIIKIRKHNFFLITIANILGLSTQNKQILRIHSHNKNYFGPKKLYFIRKCIKSVTSIYRRSFLTKIKSTKQAINKI